LMLSKAEASNEFCSTSQLVYYNTDQYYSILVGIRLRS